MTEQNKKDLVIYRINRAKETLGEVESLIKLEYYNNAVSRIYYACYYSVTALLMKYDISAKTHDGVRQMFGLHFIKTEIFPKELGRFFTDLFEKRLTGDYDDYVLFNHETVEDLKNSSVEFISSIEKYINEK